MKTKEELNALREEIETVRRELRELTDAELAQVVGGTPGFEISKQYNFTYMMNHTSGVHVKEGKIP